MQKPVDNYWKLRLEALQVVLEQNNHSVYQAGTVEEAATVVRDQILPEVNPKSISWGGSMTFGASGLYDTLKMSTDVEVIDTFDKSLSPQEAYERRRRALLVDLFLTGTNAVTETGLLVNLDMIGNRIGALTFGPRHVVVLIGRNKMVPDVEDAMTRIKNFVAPANAIRLNMKTPCVETGICQDCSSPFRICNTWTITEKSFPKGRVKIILINQEVGL